MTEEGEEKIEREFKRASTGNPVYKARSNGLSSRWMCSCGASITIDSHLIGEGVATYATWCNRCDKAMDRDGQPAQVAVLDLAAKYGFTGTDNTPQEKKK